jgi:hypothetical protein
MVTDSSPPDDAGFHISYFPLDDNDDDRSTGRSPEACSTIEESAGEGSTLSWAIELEGVGIFSASPRGRRVDTGPIDEVRSLVRDVTELTAELKDASKGSPPSPSSWQDFIDELRAFIVALLGIFTESKLELRSGSGSEF